MKLAMVEKTKFRLTKATLGIACVDGERTSVMIPANAIVEVRSAAKNDRLIDVLWEGQTLAMFAEDVRAWGNQISSRSSPAYAATVCEENLRLLTGSGSTKAPQKTAEEASASKRAVKNRQNL